MFGLKMTIGIRTKYLVPTCLRKRTFTAIGLKKLNKNHLGGIKIDLSNKAERERERERESVCVSYTDDTFYLITIEVFFHKFFYHF